MAEIVFKQESFAIVGACFEVYNHMGCGFLEPVYQECLELEFAHRDVLFSPQQRLSLSYKRTPLKTAYVPDFICFGKIIVELKALTEITDRHRAQLHNYLKATGLKLGLLVNFGQHPSLVHERIIR